MSTITPEELKKAAFLPDSANFHGWLIHNPQLDDFLFKYQDNRDCVNKIWVPFPDRAMRFNRFNRAFKVVERLGLDNAIIVAAFDLGKQIIVLAPEEHMDCSLPSPNVCRVDSIDH